MPEAHPPPQRTMGIVVVIAAMGMTLGLVGAEIASLQNWDTITTPAFIGKTFIHISTVIASAVGGSLFSKRTQSTR